MHFDVVYTGYTMVLYGHIYDGCCMLEWDECRGHEWLMNENVFLRRQWWCMQNSADLSKLSDTLLARALKDTLKSLLRCSLETRLDTSLSERLVTTWPPPSSMVSVCCCTWDTDYMTFSVNPHWYTKGLRTGHIDWLDLQWDAIQIYGHSADRPQWWLDHHWDATLTAIPITG